MIISLRHCHSTKRNNISLLNFLFRKNLDIFYGLAHAQCSNGTRNGRSVMAFTDLFTDNVISLKYFSTGLNIIVDYFQSLQLSQYDLHFGKY